jgi:hypothetical protein
MIKNDKAASNTENNMNDATTAMIRETLALYNNDAEKTARWFAKLIRSSIADVRPLVAEAIR